MKNTLDTLHAAIRERLEKIPFEAVFEGFQPFPFALYDEDTVRLEHEEFPRDDRFRGNTAIRYDDGHLAIWHVDESTRSLSVDRLTSKIVHEMFHAHQMSVGEQRFANEIVAIDYPYDELNLSAKHEENRLLCELLDDFDVSLVDEIRAIRGFRKREFPEAFLYETRVETYEGMAVYAEMKALESLNRREFQQSLADMKKSLSAPESLFPVRTINNTSGAAIMLAFDKERWMHSVGRETRTLSDLVFAPYPDRGEFRAVRPEVQKRVHQFHEKNKATIVACLETAKNHDKGPFRIIGFDPLNTLKHGEHIFFRHFVMLEKDGERRAITSPSVARTDESMNILEIHYQ